MKRDIALRAAAPSPGTPSTVASIAASQIELSIVAAWVSTRDTDVVPSPRLGELTIRWNATTSCGFCRKVRYASASLISARS